MSFISLYPSALSFVTRNVFKISRPFWKSSFLYHINESYSKNDVDIPNREKNEVDST
jgi:hypothetical protein